MFAAAECAAAAAPGTRRLAPRARPVPASCAAHRRSRPAARWRAKRARACGHRGPSSRADPGRVLESRRSCGGRDRGGAVGRRWVGWCAGGGGACVERSGGRRLAAPGHARREPGNTDQLPRGAGVAAARHRRQGLQSGPHTGRLVFYSTHTGGSFLPSHAVRARASTVTVSATRRRLRRRRCASARTSRCPRPTRCRRRRPAKPIAGDGGERDAVSLAPGPRAAGGHA